MKLRKTFLVLACAAAATSGALAQSLPEEDSWRSVRFSARLSFEVSSPSGGRDYYDNGAGLNVGAMATVPITRRIFFEPGVLFYYNAMSVKNEQLEALKLYSGSARNSGIRVPLNFGYTFPLLDNLSLEAYTGPWVNFNISAKQTMNAAPESPYEKYYDNNLFHQGFKRVDAQWGFGLNLTWYEHLVLGVSFGVGMTPMMKNSAIHNEMTMRRNSFQVNLAYKF